MDSNSGDEIPSRRSMGCFGATFSGSNSIIEKGIQREGSSAAPQMAKQIPARTSTFTRWFGSSAGEDTVPATEALEFEHVDQDKMLAQLAEDLLALDDDPHPASSTQTPSPKTPAHERKRSWPFSVSRRIVPQPFAGTSTTTTPNNNNSNTKKSQNNTTPPPRSPLTRQIQGEEAMNNSNGKPPVLHQASATSVLPLGTADEDISITRSSTTESEDFTQDTSTAGASTVTLSEAEIFNQDGSVSATRRLWKTISGVRKGDKVLPVQARNQGREVTVESLVRAVQQLKPSQSINEATRLMDGLFRLDSRAIAALLKDLAKAGMPQRASELFDYLRGLPAGDELAHLADLYTYTTVISQCVGHQQLRRALELVAEMRSKGIQCNVHTYSALMSVCVKCNECELALDVYDQLISENCTPNLVTYNILIDAFSKTSQWSRAVDVLDNIRAQGLLPEARTYNSIISCCGKCGQPQAAVDIYRAMLKDGVEPTGTTYTSVVSAFGRTGQVEEALAVYQEMRARGCERNVITFSSLISVCERAGRADVALGLLEEMNEAGVKPNVVTFNGLIGACVASGMWDKALELYDELLTAGCRPDTTTFTSLMHACERSGRWQQALHALDQMQQRGLRPDACIYNSVLGVLWEAGRLPALRRASQVLAAAQRQGPLRLQATTPSDSTIAAYTHGAAVLVTLKWLAQLRDTVTVPGYMAPRAVKSLLLTRVKQAKEGHPPFAALKSHMATLMSAFAAPVNIDLTPQGLLLTVDVMQLPLWANTPGGQALLSLVDSTSAAPIVVTGTVIKEDRVAEVQCGKAFAAVQQFEAQHAELMTGSPHHMVGSGGQLRQDVITCITALSTGLGLREETSHDAVQLCDRLLARSVPTQQPPPAACAAALLLLASRQSGEAAAVLRNGQLVLQAAGLPQSAVLEAEARVLSALNQDASAISALRVLQLYHERLGCDAVSMQKCQLLHVMVLSAINMVTKAALSPAMVSFPPSIVAAGCLIKARAAMGLTPAWPAVLRSMTGLDPVGNAGLQQCLELLVALNIGGA